MPQPRVRSLALLALPFLLVAAGCEDDDSPTAPSAPTAGSGDTGATGSGQQVRGTERLAWSQLGDVSRLKFRAYVDGRAFDLPAATCSASGGEAECHSPLPALSNGAHTIALVNISASGIESERSAPITLQKVSPSSTLGALRLASSGALSVEQVITLGDDLAFIADIVATGVHAPAQLAWLPDGRLLVSDAEGRVRIVRPGEPEGREPALEAGMLTSLAAGPMGLASHPDFAKNRFVYVSLLEQERPDQTRLRVVRLREVGDTLGEAATLFEAPVMHEGTSAQAGPRMAFGPDRLLYVMLPPGMEFVNEPAASAPLASMLRLSYDGRATADAPLSGITSTPLAFTWHPATGAMWVMFRGENGGATVQSLGDRVRVSAFAEALADKQTMRAEPTGLRVREGVGSAAGTLLLQSAPSDLLAALGGTRAEALKGIARLALPVQADGKSPDRIGDVVAGDGGTLFVAMNNGLLAGGAAGADSDVVVRLRPVPTAAR
jgi:hypothetical protein